MSYQVIEKVNGVVGNTFSSEAEARAFIDEEIAEGLDNEANWLLELAHATSEGGSVNLDDDVYVRRILAVAEPERQAVARQCARERMVADYSVVRTP